MAMSSVKVLFFCLSGFILLAFPRMIEAQGWVIASTSLTGAISKAAGAKEVKVLTPYEMRHPPEYELKPSDLLGFEGAKVIVYAGYERMVAKLLETAKTKDMIAIQIDTGTSPQNLIEQARRISKVLGTERKEQEWEKSFLKKLKSLREKLSPFSGKRTVIHRFAVPFAEWAGLGIVFAISPGEPTPKVIADALSKQPELVLDMLHFPIAKVIAENAKCKYVQVINFPGVDKTRTLEDIFEYNSTQLLKTLQ